MQSPVVLRTLLARLERMHPDDAAAVVAELAEAQRSWILEYYRDSPNADHAPLGEASGQQSAWLLELRQPDSASTDHARALLVRHLDAHAHQTVATIRPAPRGAAALGALWRSWFDPGQRA